MAVFTHVRRRGRIKRFLSPSQAHSNIDEHERNARHAWPDVNSGELDIRVGLVCGEKKNRPGSIGNHEQSRMESQICDKRINRSTFDEYCQGRLGRRWVSRTKTQPNVHTYCYVAVCLTKPSLVNSPHLV
jgi:hypothetical protein